MQTKETAPLVSNLFTDLLGRIRDGELQTDASQKLNELVQAVRNHGKPGTLTLKIKVVPTGKSRLVKFEAEDVVAKMPPEKKEETFLYQTDDGRLVSDNPDQMKLSLREVEKAPADVREVSKDEAVPRRAVGG